MYPHAEIPYWRNWHIFKKRGELEKAIVTAGKAAEFYLGMGDMDRALLLYRDEVDLAARIDDLEALGNALSAQSEILFFRNEYQERLTVNRRLHQVNLAQNDLVHAASALARIGDSYRCLGVLDSALLYSQRAIDDMPSDAPATSILYVRDVKARTLTDLNSFEEALAIHLDNLKTLEAEKDTTRLVPILNSITSFLIEQNDLPKASEFALRTTGLLKHQDLPLGKAANLKLLGIIKFAQEQHASALNYFTKSLKIYTRRNNRFHIADVSYRIGLLLSKQGKYAEAMAKYEAALQIFRQVKDADSILNTEMAYAEALTKTGSIDRAIGLLNKCRDEARQNGQLTNLKRAYLGLADTYSARKDFEAALQNHRAYYSANDSLFNSERLKIVNELEARYQFEKTRRDMSELEQKNALRATAIKAQKQLSLVLGASAVILAGLALFFYRNLQKNKLITLQQTTLDRQKIRELEQENELASLRAMIKGQNQERKRIANDLHDSLGGLLSTVKLRFDAARQAVFSPTQQLAFNKGNELLDLACAEVRNIAHNLMPESITKFGLHAAIEDLCDALQETTPSRINFQTINLHTSIEENRALNLYRIVQELLHNAIKHALAANVLIQLAQQQDTIHLTVEDDGTGFDPRNSTHRGMGLKSVHSRVRYLGGKLDVESHPQKGTTFHISVPLTYEPNPKTAPS